ncbi:hypothetical protein AO385_1922 [Moraxella catarrhalis]|nr:hypothetical protein AO385_1922 [Moraxella catarrhalis]
MLWHSLGVFLAKIWAWVRCDAPKIRSVLRCLPQSKQRIRAPNYCHNQSVWDKVANGLSRPTKHCQFDVQTQNQAV